MERYEFEDLISDFIENNLSLKKRKLFLEYLEKNQSAKKLVDEIRSNIKKLNRSPNLSASHDFNDRIISSVKNIKLKPELIKLNDKRRLYGFSYLQSGLIFCFLVVIEHAKVALTSPTTTTQSGFSISRTFSNSIIVFPTC